MEAKWNGFIKGIKIADTIVIYHMLFVDDILLFGRGNLREMNYLKIILISFCKSTRMEINMNTSCILFNDFSDNMKRQIAQFFQMMVELLDNEVSIWVLF